MSRRVTSIVVASLLAAVLFAFVTTSDGVHLWGEPTWDPAPIERDPIERDSADVAERQLVPDETDSSPADLPDWIEDVLSVLLIAFGFAGAVALATYGWRNRPRLRWTRRWARDADFDALPDIASAIVDEAAAQRATLLDGAPRNAIVRCWLRLEEDVAAVGLVRDRSDTSAEFTERVLARYTVEPQAIHELAAMYREARFSRHPIDEDSRTAALAALERLHRSLIDAATETDLTDAADATSGVPS